MHWVCPLRVALLLLPVEPFLAVLVAQNWSPLLILDDLFLRIAQIGQAARMAALWWKIQLPWTSWFLDNKAGLCIDKGN